MAVTAPTPAPDGFKRCTKCGELKPLDAFTRESHTYRRRVCRACRNVWQIKNRDKAGSNARRKAVYHANPFKGLARMKYAAHRNGRQDSPGWPHEPFTATPEALETAWKAQGGLCALMGWPMKLERDTRELMAQQRGNHSYNLASVDRIDNDHGYTDIDGKHNWQWVGWDANSWRGNRTLEELDAMCAARLRKAGWTLTPPAKKE